MRRVASVCLLLLSAQIFAETKVANFLYAGTQVGTQTLSLNSDGTFDSKSEIKIANVEIKSQISGRMVKNVVSEFRLVESQGGQSGDVTWKAGKATIVANGKQVVKDQAAPWNGKTLLATYHPLLASPILEAARVAKDRTQIKVFSPNALRFLDAGIVLKTRSVPLTSGPTQITELAVTLGPTEISYAFGSNDEPLGFNIPSQMFSAVLEGAEGVFADPFSKYPELSQPIFKMPVTLTDQKMTTKDGAVLVADVNLPAKEGKFPVILLRTPYGRKAQIAAGTTFVPRGYAVVCQDVRGMGDSTGVWDPFNREVTDGKETLDWLVQQPWCDGNVGMIGASYGGLVQWSAAVTHHPALKCIIPQVSPPEPVRNIPWDHGAFLLAGNIWWSRIVAQKGADMANLFSAVPNAQAFNKMPLHKIDDAVIGKDVPFYNNWLHRPTIDKWPGAFRLDQVGGVKIPVLHISGTWDGDGIGTKLHWEALRASGGNQWMIFGPWDHIFNSKSKILGNDYGPQSLIELESVYLRFFDAFLKNKTVKQEDQPRAKVFVTGRNQWFSFPDWPAPSSKRHALYFSGKTGTSITGGSLGAAPSGPAKDTYIYDPLKAAIKSADLKVGSESASTLIDLKKSEIKGAAYFSAPFSTATVVSGPLDAEIYVSTSAKDATFHVFVLDQSPKGETHLIAMPGTHRITWTPQGIKPVKPNQVVKLTIRPWEFAHEFKVGHKLGIMVLSSSFPQFARNPGTGEPDATATKLLRAKHTIHRSRTYPSRVIFSRFEL